MKHLQEKKYVFGLEQSNYKIQLCLFKKTPAYTEECLYESHIALNIM